MYPILYIQYIYCIVCNAYCRNEVANSVVTFDLIWICITRIHPVYTAFRGQGSCTSLEIYIWECTRVYHKLIRSLQCTHVFFQSEPFLGSQHCTYALIRWCEEKEWHDFFRFCMFVVLYNTKFMSTFKFDVFF